MNVELGAYWAPSVFLGMKNQPIHKRQTVQQWRRPQNQRRGEVVNLMLHHLPSWWSLGYLNTMTVLLQQPPASQQCFPLTPLQQQPPATSQPTVFFSHTTPAAASSTSTANMAYIRGPVTFTPSVAADGLWRWLLSLTQSYDRERNPGYVLSPDWKFRCLHLVPACCFIWLLG